jgi:hypothetical protein
MADPFFDPGLIVTALLSAVETMPSPVAVYELGEVDDTRDPRVAEVPNRVQVVAERTQIEGPGGLGNGDTAVETIALVLRVQDPTPDDEGHASRVTLRDLRGFVYAALAGVSVDAHWSPLRYLGGELLMQERGVYRSYHWVERYSTETTLAERCW